MFQFYEPWFALLLPLPLLVKFIPWLLNFKAPVAKPPTLFFPAIDRIKTAFSTSGAIRQQTNLSYYLLLGLTWILLILALMQPEKVDQYVNVRHEGLDLMLAVDISGSMQALDFSTSTKTYSRLDATKEAVSKFVLERKGDRVGLIVFGENAYLHVPLTLDTESVSRMLNTVVSGMAGNATAIGDAIGVGVKALRERPAGSRVIVLLTDGEDNASTIPPLEAAKLAKEYGIRIYTIGVGKTGNVPFPLKNGGHAMAKVTIDVNLLKKIAEMTGAQSFLATDKNALQSIYEKINQLEKTESEESLFLIRQPLFYYPLSAAMAILLILVSYQLFSWSAYRGS